MPPALMPILAWMPSTPLRWSHTHDTDSMDTAAVLPDTASDSSSVSEADDDAEVDEDDMELDIVLPEGAVLLASSGSTLPASLSKRERLLARLCRRSCWRRLHTDSKSSASHAHAWMLTQEHLRH